MNGQTQGNKHGFCTCPEAITEVDPKGKRCSEYEGVVHFNDRCRKGKHVDQTWIKHFAPCRSAPKTKMTTPKPVGSRREAGHSQVVAA